MTDDIGYQALTQAAMRGVMREALKVAASPAGLPGGHHFYITFRTRAPGVVIAEPLLKRYPEEITIVIQHQFWDLEIHDRHFEIVLRFGGVPQHLVVPYSAVTRFHDPSVNFGFGLEPVLPGQVTEIDPVPEGEAEAETAPAAEEETETPRPASDGSVVQLDAFRRK